MDSKILEEAIKLAYEARNAIDTKYWINNKWVESSKTSALNLYSQLGGIQLLLVRSGLSETEACTIVNEQFKYIGKILDTK